jgi:predicted O-methyltransferase YrrM
MNHASLPGWFDFHDFYEWMHAAAPAGSEFVEVGTCFGKSAVFMAELFRDCGKACKFTTIDLFDPARTEDIIADVMRWQCAEHKQDGWIPLVKHFVDLCRVTPFVEVIQAESVEFSRTKADKSLQFVFIDGDHRYDGVIRDLEAWIPKVRPGGFIAGHDIDVPDVAKAVTQRIGKYNLSEPRTWWKRL